MNLRFEMLLRCSIVFFSFLVNVQLLLADESSSSIAELSVPPSHHREYSENRPSWLTSRSEGGRLVLITEAYKTAEEAQLALSKLKQEASVPLLCESIAGLTQTPFQKPDLILTTHQIDQMLVQRTYQGTVMLGGVLHYESAAELIVSEEALSFVAANIKTSIVRDRVRQTLGAAVCLTFVFSIAGVITSKVSSRSSK